MHRIPWHLITHWCIAHEGVMWKWKCVKLHFRRGKGDEVRAKEERNRRICIRHATAVYDEQSQCNIRGDFMIDAPWSLVYIVRVLHKHACWDTMPFAPGVKQPSAIVCVTPLTFSQINLPHTRLPISLCEATSVHADRGRHNIPPAGQCICSTHIQCMTDWVRSAALCHGSEQP